MSNKEFTIQEVCGELAKTIKGKVDAFASEVEAMRKAEVNRPKRGVKLAKAELCPLCGNPDRPGVCLCTIRKNADEGKLPGDAKSKKVPAEGSGGQLTKAALGGAKITGTPGQQPVGMGGGDAHKVGAGAPTSVAQANKELGGMKSIASSPTAMPTGGGLVGAPPAGAPKMSSIPAGKPAMGGLPGPLQGARDKMNLQADMKAGGVGWLQRKRAAAAPAPTASAPAAGGSPFGPAGGRASGIAASQAALARGEKDPGKKPFEIKGNTPAFRPNEMKVKAGMAKDEKLAGIKDPAKAGRTVANLRAKGNNLHTNASLDAVKALSPKAKSFMTKAEMGNCAVCKGEEHAGLCKGFNVSNHNRRLLKIGR